MESQYHAAVKLKAFLFHFPLPIKAMLVDKKSTREHTLFPTSL